VASATYTYFTSTGENCHTAYQIAHVLSLRNNGMIYDYSQLKVYDPRKFDVNVRKVDQGKQTK
jgi:methionyl-tRNA synthetase